ncbi:MULTISPECIES: hypothetical protein [Streptomyces]|uniref:Integral membrane protein n=1 Tax=Streptomyces hydrogenans TaxID=1873719 RepID=A0ABQ3P1X9_9ACTN|nr:MULTISPECIES: hypothetical protein [Streptomyces]MCM1944018.1 hypothetical protein [Streptomyces sp. G2]GHE28855.1 hypothetical protein GCM10018784_78220 [Streptomyces hydrogenans]GHI19018.1 hypothetical protein Shyd_03890 [Streptomyces hydrogenans]
MPDRQSTNDNNPFAPPPEGRPDQPWQPRRPDGAEGSDGPDGEGAEPSSPGTGSSDGRWSPRQPGRSSDGFGRGPERGPERQGGQGGSGPERPGLRWDPTDPAQRRARYAILGGMWAFFFAIFDIPELALLLGALSLYWAISSLRAKPKAPAEVSPESQAASQPSGQPAAAPGAPNPVRSMRTAAISGLVASAVALSIVAFGFTMQLVYKDFYECRDDALTHAGAVACNDLLPKPLRDGFGVRD